MQKYSREVIDKSRIVKLDKPFELEERVGFPYRLDRSSSESSIMIMGINPAGDKVDDKDYMCIIPDCELQYNPYVYKKYYKDNYNLVKDLGVKLFWSSYNLSKDIMKENIIPNLENIHITEKEKSGMYLVFTNSIYIHETSSTRLQEVLVKDDLN